MKGLKSITSSSWKLLSSNTTYSKLFSAVKKEKLLPILPANPTLLPELLRMWCIREHVVVLPLDPVTPIRIEFVNLKANSISEMIGIFLDFILTIMSELLETPGLLTTSLALKNLFRVCPPSS